MAKLSDFKMKANVSEENKTEDINDTYEKLKNMPQEELNSMLFDEVAKQKREGTFDYSKLNEMVEYLKSGLSESDYHNVKRMLDLLR